MIKYNRAREEREALVQCGLAWIEGSFTFFLLGCGCFMTAFIAPNWSVTGARENSGLWRSCFETSCYSLIEDRDGVTASLKAAQTLYCFALIDLVATFALVVLYLVDYPLTAETKMMVRVVYNLMQFAAGILTLIAGIVYFASLSNRSIDWAGAVGMVGSVVFLINTAINFCVLFVMNNCSLSTI